MDETKFHNVLKRIGIEPHADSLTFENYRGKRQIAFREIEIIKTCDARYSILRKLGFWIAKFSLYGALSTESYLTERLEYRYSKGLSIKLKNGRELFKNVGEIDLITTNAALEELNEIIYKQRHS